MSFVLVYITTPTKKDTEKVAMHLLEKKLVACAKIFPVESRYWWEGKLVRQKEFMLLLETTEENFRKIKTEVKKIHPYSVPCISKIDAEANEDFEKWIRGEVK